MVAAFLFSAQPTSRNSEDLKDKPPDPKSSTKRARSNDDEESDILRSSMGESFKSKLLNASNPNQWQGFGSGKERLKISEGDITITEGLSSLL